MAANIEKKFVMTESVAELLGRVDVNEKGRRLYVITRPDGTICHAWCGSPHDAKRTAFDYDGYQVELADPKVLLAGMKDAASKAAIAAATPTPAIETPASTETAPVVS